MLPLPEEFMTVMCKKIGKVPVKPGRRAAGTSPVHEIQRTVGIILSIQGAVHALDCLGRDLHRVNGAVGNGLKLGWLVYNCLYTVWEFL